MDVAVKRDNKTLHISVTPEAVKDENKKTIGRFGSYAPTEKGVLSAVAYGATSTVDIGNQILETFGNLVTGQFKINMLAGPVGIYDMTDQVAKTGLVNLVRFGAFLSINLGIVNLLPIPALDGGRLLFLFIEAIRGKPINREKEAFVVFIGVAFLMLLMLVVTWNDIQRLFL